MQGRNSCPKEAERWAREIGREMAKTDGSERMNRRHTMAKRRGWGGGDLSEPSEQCRLEPRGRE